MKYLKIRNTGVLDIRLISLMGGTTKRNDEFKIGKFGTGLKYVLSWSFRSNTDMKVFCGTEEIKLTTKTENIANTDFEVIHIDGQRSSITTNMGEDWQPWMIVRELWCNALDEGGAEKSIVTDVIGEEGCTIFYVQLTSDIQKVMKEWDKYFLHDTQPLWQDAFYAVYPGGKGLRLYKNGVMIHEDNREGLESVFSYDLKDAQINELREFKGVISSSVTSLLYHVPQPQAEYFLQTVTEKHFEGNIDLEWYGTFNSAWRDAIGKLKLVHTKAMELAIQRNINMDTSSLIVVPKNVFHVLVKQWPEVAAIKLASGITEFYPEEDEAMKLLIEKGLAILKECGYTFSPLLDFAYGHFDDKRIEARINRQEKIVYVSNTMKSNSLFNVIAMLIEENEHFLTGLSDETRAFQQHFINLYALTLTKTKDL